MVSDSAGNEFIVDAVSTYETAGETRTGNIGVASVTATWRPLAGSAAINSADKDRRFALDDFDGNLRGATVSLGALEP